MTLPLPVQQNAGISYLDGPPSVSCAAFCVHEGLLTEPADCFGLPFWNSVRDAVSHKAVEMRRQGSRYDVVLFGTPVWAGHGCRKPRERPR